MKKTVACSVLLICMNLFAREFENEEEKSSYALGILIAETLKQASIEIDEKMMLEGINDYLKDRNDLSLEEAKQIMGNAVEKRDDEISEENRRNGKEFLEKNGMEKGVVTLSSGLQYKILKTGDGLMPAINDTVTVHYEGRTIDGKIFDSSYDREEPAVFNISQVITGWQEALQLMNEGSIWMVYIPSELAYGNSRAGNRIGRNSVLIFKIELLKIGE